MGASRSRRAPRSHEVAGLTRSNAKLRSKPVLMDYNSSARYLRGYDLRQWHSNCMELMPVEGAILDHSRRSGGERSKRTQSDGVRQGKCRGGSLMSQQGLEQNIKTRLDLRRGSLGSENLQHSKCPVLQQNTKLRHRTPHGVRRGHPAGRPEPTRRLLSALCGALLPFAHGFDDSDRDPLKLMSSKVGQCRARFACWVRNISS